MREFCVIKALLQSCDGSQDPQAFPARISAPQLSRISVYKNMER